jgi:restriction endonuclease S subunit
MTLGDLVEFKTNSEDADFWLIRKGSEDTVGKPTKEYSPEHIGVTIKDNSVLNPQYLYYYFMMLQNRGFFKRLATGTLRLKNIRISDIKSIPVAM